MGEKARRHEGTEARRGRSAWDVVVIGAGPNGLTAAAVLAKAGRKVVVLEQRDVVGGLAACEEFHPGYRSAGLLHDTAGIINVVREELGLQGDTLEWALPPPVFVPQASGPGLLLHDNAVDAAAEIKQHSERDAERYAAFREFFGRSSAFFSGLVSEEPPNVANGDLTSLMQLARTGWTLRRMGRADMMEVLRVLPMCVADWLGEWFECELLQAALAAPALDGTWTGPWSPGSNAMLLRRESTRGPVARGGVPAVIDAIVAAARSHGVEIRTGVDVTGIRVDGDTVTGVTLAGGETIDAATVLATCDPKRVMLGLLPVGQLTPRTESRIDNFRSRGTTAKVNLALSTPPRFACREDLDVEYARVGETIDDLERAFDAVKYDQASENPILDVYVPTKSNPNFAPTGHAVMSVVVHFAPYHLAGGWTDEQRETLGDRVVSTLAKYIPGVEGSIVGREVLTPADLETRYGTTGGHIHHGEHALDQLMVRPCPECARYRTPVSGLYLGGSGSHPGGGLTCAPGFLSARTILQS